jgi:hypothetical protein
VALWLLLPRLAPLDAVDSAQNPISCYRRPMPAALHWLVKARSRDHAPAPIWSDASAEDHARKSAIPGRYGVSE